MTAAQLYKQLTEGKINQSQFMSQIRKNPTVKGLINNVMGYNDIVKVLKNKGIITEIKTPEIPPIQKKGLLSEACACEDKVDEIKFKPSGVDGNSIEDFNSIDNKGGYETLGSGSSLTDDKLDQLLTNISSAYPELKDKLEYLVSIGDYRGFLRLCKDYNITISPDWKFVRNPRMNEDSEIPNGEIPQDAGSDGPEIDSFPIHTQYQSSGPLSPEKWEKLMSYAKNNVVDLYYELEDAQSYFFSPSASERGTIDLNDKEFQQYITNIIKDHGLTVNLNWDVVPDASLNEVKVKEQKHSEDINAQEYRKGIYQEYKKCKIIDSDKIIGTVLKNLQKDPFYYTNLENNIKKFKKIPSNQMKPVTKTNQVDKENGVTKKKLQEIHFSGEPGQSPNTVVTKAQTYIESNPTLKQLSNEITLSNAGDTSANLKYGYYKVLPSEAKLKLELQFNISEDNHDDEDTGNGVAYVLSLKDGKADPTDLGNSFSKFKNHLNELVEEVYDEMIREKKQSLNEITKPYDPKILGMNVGQKFILSNDLGNFKKGEEIIVESIKVAGLDVEVNFKNKNGIKDNYFFDKEDRIIL
jgi:hypothetical protein